MPVHTFEELGIRVKNPNAAREKTTCPVCSPARKNKSDHCLTVWPVDGNWSCHHCGWVGSIYEKREGVEGHFQAADAIILDLPDRTINYFKNRGISKETLSYFKVTQTHCWMPPTVNRDGTPAAKERDAINFNYFKNNRLVNTKFRCPLKTFKLQTGGELTLYNYDGVFHRDDMLIAEGEIDAMSWYEASYFGATSVPNGAPPIPKNGPYSPDLKYLDNAAELFKNKAKIYIATDNDAPGQALKNELVRRLGRHRCWVVEYPDDCKDANDVLVKHGADSLRQCMKDAIAPKLEQILTVEDVESDLDHIFEHGYPEGMKTGFKDFDQLYSFLPRRVTTVTGISHHGKSDAIDQIMIRLAVRHEAKFGIFSPENEVVEQIIKLEQKYAGQPLFKRMNQDGMSRAVHDASKQFINKHFFFFDTDQVDMTIDGLLKKAEELVLRKGISFFLIDPYNYIESRRERSQTETEYVSEIMGKLKIFAKKFNAHVILIAHPTKVPKDRDTKKPEIPTLSMISGSGNFQNKTDGGIVVYRNFDDNTTDVYVQKAKPFYVGKVGVVTWYYEVASGVYSEKFGEYRGEIQEVRPEPTVEVGYVNAFPDNASSFFVPPHEPQEKDDDCPF